VIPYTRTELTNMVVEGLMMKDGIDRAKLFILAYVRNLLVTTFMG
jgi:hypothetical protein